MPLNFHSRSTKAKAKGVAASEDCASSGQRSDILANSIDSHKSCDQRGFHLDHLATTNSGMFQVGTLTDVESELRRSVQRSVIGKDIVDILVPKSSMGSKIQQKMRDFCTEKLIQSQRRLTKLYGRDGELELLRNALELLTTSPQYRSLILLCGLSGEGKTALALQLQDPAERKGCFFAFGKFDLASIGQPFSGIKTAIARLISDKILQSLSPGRLKELRNEMRLKMGWEIDLLSQVIPEVAVLASAGGRGHATSEIFVDGIGVAGADRLQFAFRKLINIFSSFAPLILVCDDAQWADTASINLLKGWITDDSNAHIIIICIYRKNMVGPDHFVTKAFQAIEKMQQERLISIQKVEIGELKMKDVNDMISDMLDAEPAVTEDLTNILYHKTLGNAFFVRQYLQTLAQHGLLTYHMATSTWEWDVDEVREGSTATENVVDLMKEKLAQSSAARILLPLAACIGATFDSSLLHEILQALKTEKDQVILDIFTMALGSGLHELSKEDGIHLLEQIEREGLIEVAGVSSFAFIHDKVIEGALALVGGDLLEDLKFGIGYLLLQQCKRNESQMVDEVLYLLVNLLNGRLEMIPASKHFDVYELNVLAGDKAFRAAAYSRSALYYGAATKLLPEGHWDKMYNASLHLYMSAAESEMCLGNYVKMKSYVDEVLALDCSMLDKLPAYRVLIDAHMAKSELHQTLQLNTNVLHQLGFHFPKSGIVARTLGALANMKMRMKKWKPDALQALPISTDPVHEAISQMHVVFFVAVLMVNPDALPLAIIMGCKHVLDHGLTQYSACSFTWLGLLIINVFQDYQWARDNSEFIQSLQQKFPNRRIESRVGVLTGIFLSHWTSQIHNSIKPLLANYSGGMETCDQDSAFWSAHFYHEAALYSGKSLSMLQKDAETYCKQMFDYGMIKHSECLQIVWQLILNLRGCSENTIVLTGTAHDEGAALNAIEKTKDWHHLAHLQKDRLFAAAIFGDFEHGAALGMSSINLICKTIGGQHSTLVARFIVALSCFEMANLSKKKKFCRAALRNFNVVKKWFDKGNPNAQHYLLFLKAEKAIYEGNKDKAICFYKRTILLSGRSGYIHDCALANERLATLYLRLGDQAAAANSFKDSLKLYEEWGATKKVELMKASVKFEMSS